VILWLLACARPTIAAGELFRPPVTVTYLEHFSPGGMPPVVVEVTEATVATDRPGLPDWPGIVYETTTSYADGRNPSVTRTIVGERGVAWFASVTGGDERLFAPKLALPPAVKVRDAWSGHHGDNDRSCVVERTPFCDDGVATACTTTWPEDGRVTWMRQHWCPELGWTGFELVTVSEGGTWATAFSTDARRGEQALPDVPLSERPVPPPDSLTAR
jgi:hypothetical protein